MILSRRNLLLGLAALGGLSLLPYRKDVGSALRTALKDIELPVAPAHLDLVRFTHHQEANGQDSLHAVVRLTWPPGTRQRRFVAREAGLEKCLDSLVADIASTYSKLA